MNWCVTCLCPHTYLLSVSPVDMLASSEDDDEDEESSSEESKLLGSQKLIRKCANLCRLLMRISNAAATDGHYSFAQSWGRWVTLMNGQWFESSVIELQVCRVPLGHILVNDFTLNQRVFTISLTALTWGMSLRWLTVVNLTHPPICL